MNCLTCGCLIVEPNQFIHYSGPICSCHEPIRVRRRPDTQFPGHFSKQVELENEIADLKKRIEKLEQK